MLRFCQFGVGFDVVNIAINLDSTSLTELP